jgi:hypothetical protein
MNKKKSYWGVGIVVFFLTLFIANGIVIIVLLSQDVELVEQDYYEKELTYQDQINKEMNSNELSESLSIEYENNLLTVRLPKGINYQGVEGHIAFYRPSDAAQDFSVPIIPDSSGTQYLNVSRLDKGRWKVTVDWIFGGNEYLDKKEIFIQ